MRQAEDIRIQELKEGNPAFVHRFGRRVDAQVEPVFTVHSSLATFLITSKSFCVTRRSSSPKGCFSKNDRICFLWRYALSENQLRTSLNKAWVDPPGFSSILPCAGAQPASKAFRSAVSRISPSCRKGLFGQARAANFFPSQQL